MLKQFSYQILGILAQLIYSFLKFFIPFLPRSILFPLQNSIAKLYFCFAKKDQKILFKNLEHISLTLPSVWEKKHFCQQVFSSQIKIGTETFSYLLSPKHHPIVFEGLDEYRDHVQNVLTLHNSSKGIIFVGSHLGSWELCAKVTRLALRPKRLTVLAKPPKIKNFQKILDDIRKKMDIDIIWTQKKDLLQNIQEKILAGQNLGFIMDQKPNKQNGHLINFFNQPTLFVKGPAFFSIENNLPVVSIHCIRKSAFCYRLIFQTITHSPNAEGLTEVSLTQKIATQFEELIRLYPEQWTWNYKRWSWEKSKTGQNNIELSYTTSP